MSKKFTNVRKVAKMQVGAINNQAFGGKIKETKNGNEYEKSNEGKKYYPVLAAVGMGLNFATDNYAAKMFKLKPISNAIGLGVVAVGVGAIVDAFANKTSRQDADRFAESGIVPEKTNKGKKFMVGLGLAFSAFNTFGVEYLAKKILANGAYFIESSKKEILSAMHQTKGQKAVMLIGGLVGSLAIGQMYDSGVNKSRAKLEKKAEAEAKLDAKIEEKVDAALSQRI